VTAAQALAMDWTAKNAAMTGTPAWTRRPRRWERQDSAMFNIQLSLAMAFATQMVPTTPKLATGMAAIVASALATCPQQSVALTQ